MWEGGSKCRREGGELREKGEGRREGRDRKLG